MEIHDIAIKSIKKDFTNCSGTKEPTNQVSEHFSIFHKDQLEGEQKRINESFAEKQFDVQTAYVDENVTEIEKRLKNVSSVSSLASDVIRSKAEKLKVKQVKAFLELNSNIKKLNEEYERYKTRFSGTMDSFFLKMERH